MVRTRKNQQVIFSGWYFMLKPVSMSPVMNIFGVCAQFFSFFTPVLATPKFDFFVKFGFSRVQKMDFSVNKMLCYDISKLMSIELDNSSKINISENFQNFAFLTLFEPIFGKILWIFKVLATRPCPNLPQQGTFFRKFNVLFPEVEISW